MTRRRRASSPAAGISLPMIATVILVVYALTVAALVSAMRFDLGIIGGGALIAVVAVLVAWPRRVRRSIAWARKRRGRRARVRRRSVRPAVRWAVLKRDGYRCQYCGRSATDGAVLEVDHVLPVAHGGTDGLRNLKTSCRDCNAGKSAGG